MWTNHKFPPILCGVTKVWEKHLMTLELWSGLLKARPFIRSRVKISTQITFHRIVLFNKVLIKTNSRRHYFFLKKICLCVKVTQNIFYSFLQVSFNQALYLFSPQVKRFLVLDFCLLGLAVEFGGLHVSSFWLLTVESRNLSLTEKEKNIV